MNRRDFGKILARTAAGLLVAPDALELLTKPRRRYWPGHRFGHVVAAADWAGPFKLVTPGGTIVELHPGETLELTENGQHMVFKAVPNGHYVRVGEFTVPNGHHLIGQAPVEPLGFPNRPVVPTRNAFFKALARSG